MKKFILSLILVFVSFPLFSQELITDRMGIEVIAIPAILYDDGDSQFPNAGMAVVMSYRPKMRNIFYYDPSFEIMLGAMPQFLNKDGQTFSDLSLVGGVKFFKGFGIILGKAAWIRNEGFFPADGRFFVGFLGDF